MTNKEAIAILTYNWKYRELIDNSYQYEALDLAIKALEEIDELNNQIGDLCKNLAVIADMGEDADND